MMTAKNVPRPKARRNGRVASLHAHPEMLAEPEVSEDEDGDDDHPDDGEQVHGVPSCITLGAAEGLA